MNSNKKFGPASLLRIFQSQQGGLLLVILALGTALTMFSGSHTDPLSGRVINNFLNPNTLLQTATDASFFAIMAVGMTMVIISCGIDLSVGSIFALAGVTMAMVLRSRGDMGIVPTLLLGLGLCVVIGVACGFLNGVMVVGLNVHTFIITLGTMWVLRGIAFVASKAESILVPNKLTEVIKTPMFLGKGLCPLPTIVMILVAVVGALYLDKTVSGRHIFAVGGNEEASRYAGLGLKRVFIGVYVASGLCAGIAAFMGISYYGSASCGDATGYELYVIASAVVGGASLTGGKGNAVNAMLGAILITLIRQSIRTLHFDQNYESIIIGCAIIIAVVVDQASAKMNARRLLNARAAAVAESAGAEKK